jgi:hypothetical protein
LAESPSRTAFVHTLRSVVEPGGQRVTAVDRLYIAEGRPTLIVWGARDTVIPVAHAQRAHEAIPAAQVEIFEQSEHFPHMDEPARFARVLLHFMASTEPLALDRATIRERMAERVRQLEAAEAAGEVPVEGPAGDGTEAGGRPDPGASDGSGDEPAQG